jgi:hypothetical protein
MGLQTTLESILPRKKGSCTTPYFSGSEGYQDVNGINYQHKETADGAEATYMEFCIGLKRIV